jgi:hypothetical protein
MFDMSAPEWIRQRYGPEYVRYAAASLPPTTADSEELAAARDGARATALAQEIVGTQRPDGGWDTPPEEWYKGLPRLIETLLDYGYTPFDEPVVRAVRHMFDLQRPDGSFALDAPEQIPYDEAYNAGCVRVGASIGLRGDPNVRRAAERLLLARRHDGGWSTLPIWFRQTGVPLPDPEPSCPICTDLAVFALGTALDLPTPVRDEFMGRTLKVVPDMPPAARAEQYRDRLAFMANQGLRVGDPRVDEAVAGLNACRGPDGRFAHHESPASYLPSDLAEIQTRHVLWRVGCGT